MPDTMASADRLPGWRARPPFAPARQVMDPRHDQDSSPCDMEAVVSPAGGPRAGSLGRREHGAERCRRPATKPPPAPLLPRLVRLLATALALTDLTFAQDTPPSQARPQTRLPPGAACTTLPALANGSSQQLPPVRLFKVGAAGDAPSGDLVAPPISNSVRLLYMPKEPEGQVLVFESLCGWRNSLHAADQKQPAYWVLDRRRGALVARFDFATEDSRFATIEAQLSSPPFKPPPAYHFLNDSRYFGSCHFRFRAYMTLRAQLELFFVPIAMARANSARAGPPLLAARETIPKPVLSIFKIVDNKPALERAKSNGEWAAWSDHTAQLPTSPDLKSTHFRLEFSAVHKPINRDSTHKFDSFLNGIAIANFSLSPQCFGLEVAADELERVRQLSGHQVEVYSPSDALHDDYAEAPADWQPPAQSPLLGLIEQHKTSILVGALLVLIVVVISSQWLLCTYLSEDAGGGRQLSSKKPSLLQLACCCCASQDRRRVHAANGHESGGKHELSNGKLAAANNQFARDQMRNSYLRPLSAAILNENFELLNVNPNYAAPNSLLSGVSSSPRNSSCAGSQQLQQHQLRSLELYSIDRKRLTVTKTIGRGAFGEVYQGYLVCHYSDDGTKPITSDRHEVEDDSLESHSIKVAVKTFSDEKMKKQDFVLEANNMSQVSHRNIVKFLGVCFEKEPLFIVMEYMAGGNLKNFLLNNRDKVFYDTPPCSSSAHQHQDEADQQVRLCVGDLLVFALDIARACDYLQQRAFIHRDIAARNCLLTTNVKQLRRAAASHQQIEASNSNLISHAGSLSPLLPNMTESAAEQPHNLAGGRQSASPMRSFVGSPPSALDVDANHRVALDKVYLNGFENSTIVAKLADFGMTRDVYSSDYYRLGHRELPVRWMPPECLDGVVDTKSDVWSFGVFLWELFSMGQLPYQHLLDNHQVIEFIKSRRHASASVQQQPSTQVPAVQQQAGASQAAGSAGQDCRQRSSGQVSEQAKSAETQARLPSSSSSNHLLLEADDLDQEQRRLLLASTPAELPPLPLPHDNTPLPIYSIMCSCWATNPKERPQFQEIANRLYWCLQEASILQASLPSFYQQQSSVGSAQLRQTQTQGYQTVDSRRHQQVRTPPGGESDEETPLQRPRAVDEAQFSTDSESQYWWQRPPTSAENGRSQ